LLSLIAAVVAFAAALAGVAQFVIDRLDGGDAPTLAKCLAKAHTEPSAAKTIDSWYCETQFASFWTRGRPTMLADNKQLLRTRFAYVDPSKNRDHLGFTTESLADPHGPQEGAKLSRLFHDFPRYSQQFAAVVGQVRYLSKLSTSASGWTYWVVQFGTIREPGGLVYARFSKPSNWTPPPQHRCVVGLIDAIPIARGYTETAGSPGTQDVIYELATQFHCYPPADLKDVGAIQRDPALGPYLKKGMDPDAW
jgi:hypothetical protein